jgi:hypothetical protein
VQPCNDEDDDDDYFCSFPSNGAPVERNSQGKTEVLGEKPVPVPFCPPQIPYGLTRDRTRGLRGGRPATNRLRHDTALNKTHYKTVLLSSGEESGKAEFPLLLHPASFTVSKVNTLFLFPVPF